MRNYFASYEYSVYEYRDFIAKLQKQIEEERASYARMAIDLAKAEELLRYILDDRYRYPDVRTKIDAYFKRES